MNGWPPGDPAPAGGHDPGAQEAQGEIEEGEALVSEAKELTKKALKTYCRGLRTLLDAMPKLPEHSLRMRVAGYLDEAEKLKASTSSRSRPPTRADWKPKRKPKRAQSELQTEPSAKKQRLPETDPDAVSEEAETARRESEEVERQLAELQRQLSDDSDDDCWWKNAWEDATSVGLSAAEQGPFEEESTPHPS